MAKSQKNLLEKSGAQSLEHRLNMGVVSIQKITENVGMFMTYAMSGMRRVSWETSTLKILAKEKEKEWIEN